MQSSIRNIMSMSNILNTEPRIANEDSAPSNDVQQDKAQDESQTTLPYVQTQNLTCRPRLPPRESVASWLVSSRSHPSYYPARSYSNEGIPPTPDLMRSDSSENEDGFNRSPTPLTPSLPGPNPVASYGYQNAAPQFQSEHYRAAATLSSLGQNPPIVSPQKSLHSAHARHSDRRSASPRSAVSEHGSIVRQYACPLASQFNCEKYFTTSGHARRHSRTHTGVRQAICPDCGQAFSRQDNMQQHRRTHRHGRQSSASDRSRRQSSTSSGQQAT